MARTSFSNSVVRAFRCHQDPEFRLFGCVDIRSALLDIIGIATGELQIAEDTVGG